MTTLSSLAVATSICVVVAVGSIGVRIVDISSLTR